MKGWSEKMYSKKEGFTLVELLAVIAILALLVIILLPNVIDLFTNAQKNTFQTEVQQVYRAAQQRFLLDGHGEKTYYRYDGTNKCTDDYGELDLQGNTSIDYYIKLNSNGGVVDLIVANEGYAFSHEGSVINIEEIGNEKNLIVEESDESGEYKNITAKIKGKCQSN